MKIISLQFSLEHKYPLHHATYAATKFKAAAANGLGEDTKLHQTARTNIRAHAWTDGRMDRRTQMDQLWYEINVPFFLQEKAGIKCLFTNTSSIFKRSIGRQTLFFYKKFA